MLLLLFHLDLLFFRLFEGLDLENIHPGEVPVFRHFDLEGDGTGEIKLLLQLLEPVGEEHQLDITMEIHNIGDTEFVSLFGDLFGDRFNFADKKRLGAVGQLVDLGAEGVVDLGQLVAVLVQRVPRDIEAQGLLLKLQDLQRLELLHGIEAQLHMGHLLAAAKEGVFGHLLGLGSFGSGLHDRFDLGQHRLAGIAQAVQCPGFDEGFDHLFVDLGGVDPGDKVAQIPERTLLAGFQNGTHGDIPGPLDGAQAEENRRFALDLIGDKSQVGAVDVGGQQLDPHVLDRIDVADYLGGVVLLQGQLGCHELGGVVTLEVGSVEGDHGVGGGVGFVEAVAGEFDDQIEELGGFGLVKALLSRSFGELPFEFVHLLLDLLSHRPAHQVRPAQREASDGLDDLHDLLLVDDNPVGRFEDRLELREHIGDLCPAVLALDEVIQHPRLHGAGAVEGQHRDDIFEGAGFELFGQILHPRRFDLKKPKCVAGGDIVVDLGIVDIHLLEVDPFAVALLDELQRLFDHRQGLEPQEVELDQIHILDILPTVLGRQGLLARGFEERSLLPEGLVGDDDAGGMGSGVAVEPLQCQGELPNLSRFGIPLDELFDLGLFFVGIFEGDFQFVGNQFGEGIGLGVGQPHDPRDVPDDPFGQKLAEGDDLGDVDSAVLLHHIVDDLLAAALAEVHIDIGHADALRIEETLEEQAVGHGIDVGDL